jgi:para-aminobenzoate synthetase
MSTLLVDNYDSYTYNVFHMLAAASGEEPIVVHNDAVTWKALSRERFDAIVISPGPGRPERWHDFGVCSDILQRSETPVLGVCLGHQGLGRAVGGIVEHAPMVMHGRLSKVQHVGNGLFEGIPQGFSVVRYHSLAVTGPFARHARITAWTADGVVMGIEHDSRPLWGVQFHPESISTEHGRRLFENFYRLARSHTQAADTRPRPPQPAKPARPAIVESPQPADETNSQKQPMLRIRRIEGEAPAERLFERLFGEAEHAFWLDSADAPTRLAQRSYLGTSAGLMRCVLEYDIEQGEVVTRRIDGETRERGSIFDVLDRELQSLAIDPPEGIDRGLIGGFVGYLGYECKIDCGSATLHRSDVPDAVMMLADRLVAVDHLTGCTHLLALCVQEDQVEAERWLDWAQALAVETIAETYQQADGHARQADGQLLQGEARAQQANGQAEQSQQADEQPPPVEPVVFRCGRGRSQYIADIERSQAALAAGESYEVCLTDQISTSSSPDPFTLYKILRANNPAPFAAYLKLGEVAVVSSSPERFLSVDRNRRVEARPIKGTARRSSNADEDRALHDELLADEKTFAEHLMIVDLLRNDLGRVCELDSVRVPELRVVESYPTVHQLISTITGALRTDRSQVDCVRACFPGGSMTGAPKVRTMEIIDELERCARGVYSGAIGYFGLDGVLDLSIVIRTIVLRPGATTIGAGGAIVIQSDPAEEFDEILLKARAPMAAIAEAVTGSRDPEAWTVELEPSRELAATQ